MGDVDPPLIIKRGEDPFGNQKRRISEKGLSELNPILTASGIRYKNIILSFRNTERLVVDVG